jgi:hypothetical protein
MAGIKRMRVSAALVVLAMFMLAGQSLAMTVSHGAPIRPTGWPQAVRLRVTSALSDAITLLHGRTLGAYGRVGWGSFRLR